MYYNALFYVLSIYFSFSNAININTKVCNGTDKRLTVPSNRADHYQSLRERYINCTHVKGNLELTWIQDGERDLSFLQNIQEITGYLLVSHVDVRKVALPNLKVIHGETGFRLPFQQDTFSFLMTLTRIRSLEMPALESVLAGSVGIVNNYELCHIKTINWTNIMTGINARYFYVYNFNVSEPDCPPCDGSCGTGCWGEGPQNCQNSRSHNCSAQCGEAGCFGSEPAQCCDALCKDGCHGAGPAYCVRCKTAKDGLECVESCPAMKYNWNGMCEPCHPACRNGCVGPGNITSQYGCKPCEKEVLDGIKFVKCIGGNETCPRGTYLTNDGTVYRNFSRNPGCMKCHPLCSQCSAYGFHMSVCECKFYRKGEQCLETCPEDFYGDNNRKSCLPCSNECRGCSGPTLAHCFTCRNYRFYSEANPENPKNGNFTCVPSCGGDFSKVMEDPLGPICTPTETTPSPVSQTFAQINLTQRLKFWISGNFSVIMEPA